MCLSFFLLYYSNALLGASLVGKIGATDYTTLAAWQTATGLEVNARNIKPIFVSATNLHLDPANNCGIDGYGEPIAGISTDLDGDVRDITTPDMGADEFTAAYTGVLAGIAGSAVCENKNVSLSGTTYATGVCDLIAKVLPSGADPVAGKVNVCVTLDATQLYFNGEPYVQRHFDAEPAAGNQSTTSATITLYFTNAEFVAYNTNNPVWPKLPTSVLGNADPNRANVRVTQFHGTPTGGLPTSTPGNYTGTRILIDPADANIVWNGSYWAVTFNVAGFSGFYLHTTIWNVPLPVSLNYFNGTRQSSNHLLNWKVTCNTTPRATMTLERSSDSRTFSGIYTLVADAARCNQPFTYTDAGPLKGMNYYRLKMTDDNGKITYSGIIALLNAVTGFDIISLAPNPVTDGNFTLQVTSARASTMELKIFDLQGRLVNRQNVSLIAGSISLPMHVDRLAAGTYNIQGSISGERSRVMRFVKQ